LNLNVYRRSGVTEGANLPVLFWICGGGFSFGSGNLYDPSSILSQAHEMGQDIIVVSANYRIGAFGFLGGQEVYNNSDGNWGLADQRTALEWVADNIASFGGDPDKVTIFGESAGSIAVAYQMLMYDGDNTYNNKPLFRGAIMDSGSITPTKQLNSSNAQEVYNQLAINAGCHDTANSFECLSRLSGQELNEAQNDIPAIFSYKSLALPFLPRWDGKKMFKEQVYDLVAKGKYAKVPYIIGDNEDEGTMFAMFNSNITTSKQFKSYIRGMFSDISDEMWSKIEKLYPDDPSEGSPYRTGQQWNWYPEYKRLSSILGDFVFQWPRRFFLDATTDVNRWSWFSTAQHGLPYVGTSHANDLLYIWFMPTLMRPGRTFKRAYVAFTNYLDPNIGSDLGPKWPEYSESRKNFVINFLSNTIADDDYRKEQSDYVNAHVKKLLF
jgi:triacylglycerol lipase